MGARLVSLALARWSHVSDRAFRVLVRMALTALDEPAHGTPAGIYFGGRDLLALTLRSERGGSHDTAYKTVQRALADLVDAGAIARTHPGRAGQNTVYRLCLEGERSIDQLPVDEPVPGPVQGDTRSPFRGTPADPPRNQEEPIEELLEEITLDLDTGVTGPRAHEPAEDQPPPLRLIEGNPDPPEPPPRGLWPAPATPGRGWGRSQDVIAAATARRQAAREAHTREVDTG